MVTGICHQTAPLARSPRPARSPAHRDAARCLVLPRLNSIRAWYTTTSNNQLLLTRSRKCATVRASYNGTHDSNEVLEQVQNVVIIGSGPAGYTAAIYAARANLRPVVFEGFQAGGVRGGQLMTTTEVENFPGFPEGISGPELMDRMRSQAERWGADLLTEDVEDVDLSSRPFVIRGTDTTAYAHSIIVATGATAKRLGLPSEHTFWSRGISACAICDGASPLFKGQEVAVVGGGDTACEEAVYLTKYAKHVHLLVRTGKFRASKAMADRASKHPNVTVHLNTVVQDAYADPKGAMAGLTLEDTATGATRQLPVKGLFYGIGHTPNSGFLNGQIETDDKGYVKVHEGCKTNIEGVFAAGDLFDTEWRQAITAAGSGCMAALSAERYLTANDLVVEIATGTEVEEEEMVTVEVPEKELALVGGGGASVSTTTAARAAPAAPATSRSNGTPASSSAAAPPSSTAGVDISATRHRGQYALRKLYHESERLLAVMYVSPTCGPCRTLKPIFNKVIDEFADKVHLIEIDIEEDPEIAQAAGVSGTPTIQFFKNKDRIVNLPGVKMKKEYRAIIEQNL